MVDSVEQIYICLISDVNNLRGLWRSHRTKIHVTCQPSWSHMTIGTQDTVIETSCTEGKTAKKMVEMTGQPRWRWTHVVVRPSSFVSHVAIQRCEPKNFEIVCTVSSLDSGQTCNCSFHRVAGLLKQRRNTPLPRTTGRTQSDTRQSGSSSVTDHAHLLISWTMRKLTLKWHPGCEVEQN